MRRLFYLSGTLFFFAFTLLVAVHIGQRLAMADCDPRGHIVAEGSSVFLTEYGEAWITGFSGWERWSDWDVPSHLMSSMKFFSGNTIITESDEAWYRQGPGPDGWTSIGLVPDGPIAIAPTTWGQLKRKY